MSKPNLPPSPNPVPALRPYDAPATTLTREPVHLPTDWTACDMAQLHAAYREGVVTPSQVCQAHLDAAALKNPALHAFIHIDHQGALEQARASTQRWQTGHPLGALDGIPMAVKDNIDVAGLPCTAGTQAYAQRVPLRNAPVAQTLLDAGAVLLGKLNLHEAALGATSDNPFYGRCNNPLLPGCTPGGSSGGSAAAVAAHLSVAALGTDTMGSVRVPASYCGVFGFKPSHGRIEVDGIVPLAPSFDSVGVLGRSAADTASVVRQLMHLGQGKRQTFQGVRLGWLTPSNTVDVEPSVQQPIQAALAQLVQAGATLQHLDMAAWQPSAARRACLLQVESEAMAYWGHALGPDLGSLSDGLKSMLRFPASQSANKLAAAAQQVQAIRDAASALFEQVDLVVMPTTPQLAFAHQTVVPANQADFTALANYLGAPAWAIPLPGESLPASLQLMAAAGRDEWLLDLAGAIDASFRC